MSLPSPPNYSLGDKLGQGSNGTVYKAFIKNKTSKAVAIKCISKKMLNKAASDNLVSEISILKKVKHEYIVDMVDFSWDKNFIYLVLELCQGGDLSKYIRKFGYLEECVMRRFLQQLACGLEALYQLSVLHMDLKPQNILLTASEKSPKLKIADFGFAKNLEGSVKMQYLRGSLLYMAPEVYLHGLYTNKCDLWSVGVIIYECLYGRAPYHSSSLEELKMKIVDDKPIKISQTHNNMVISQQCVQLLSNLLERDVHQRITYKEFLNHPYIDIQHAPTSTSSMKAESCLSDAKKCELLLREKARSKGQKKQYNGHDVSHLELRSIYQKFLDGLSHMIAAVHYEESDVLKNQLKEKLSIEFEHAEQLHDELENDIDHVEDEAENVGGYIVDNKTESLPLHFVNDDTNLAIPPTSLQSTFRTSRCRDVVNYNDSDKDPRSTESKSLEHLCRDYKDLMDGLKKLDQFYILVKRGKYKSALNLFKSFFEELYAATKNDKENKIRQQLMYNELDAALNTAESISDLINTNNSWDIMKKRREALTNTDSICSIS